MLYSLNVNNNKIRHSKYILFYIQLYYTEKWLNTLQFWKENEKKVLYRKSSFLDNYTDPNFFYKIKRNVHFKPTNIIVENWYRLEYPHKSASQLYFDLFSSKLQLKKGNAICKLTYGFFSFIIVAAYDGLCRFQQHSTSPEKCFYIDSCGLWLHTWAQNID